VLKLILFIIPLGLDTFAIAAALGVRGLDSRARLRASLLMAGFEMTMPVIGLFVGRGLGSAVGGAAGYVASACLAGVGVWMLFGDEEAEQEGARAFADLHGLALLGLGISISIDELAIGFSIGLLGLSIVAAVLLIGAQAFVFAQVGARVGARLGEEIREGAERVAGLSLIALAILTLVEQLR
jgi:manganese efflux pump family protein